MPGIESAYRGRMNMLNSIFGSSDPLPRPDSGSSLFKDLKRMAARNKAKAEKNG